jgi:hypothetical protein
VAGWAALYAPRNDTILAEEAGSGLGGDGGDGGGLGGGGGAENWRGGEEGSGWWWSGDDGSGDAGSGDAGSGWGDGDGSGSGLPPCVVDPLLHGHFIKEHADIARYLTRPHMIAWHRLA